MRRLAVCATAFVLGAALAPSASGKGPIDASLDGPGLGAPIEFGGWTTRGAEDNAPVGPLAEAAGFFPAAFGQSSVGPMRATRPNGDLGPRYTLTYGLGGPQGDESRIVQNLYPYAEPHPVTYMAPEQAFYGAMKTQGGWFVASASPNAPPLDYVLREAGLPRTPPTDSDGLPFPWATAALVGTLLVLGALTAIVIRRRPYAATP